MRIPYCREFCRDEYIELAPSTSGVRRAEPGRLIAVTDLMASIFPQE
jgi:hypothetical protein